MSGDSADRAKSSESAAGERLTCPVGFTPCLDSTDLYYRWEAAEKESFFGCEYLGVTLFNGGDVLVDVRLKLSGRDAGGNLLFEIERKVHRMDRGQPTSFELARHELPEVPEVLEMALIGGQHPPEDESKERRQSWSPWWSSQWEGYS